MPNLFNELSRLHPNFDDLMSSNCTNAQISTYIKKKISGCDTPTLITRGGVIPTPTLPFYHSFSSFGTDLWRGRHVSHEYARQVNLEASDDACKMLDAANLKWSVTKWCHKWTKNIIRHSKIQFAEKRTDKVVRNAVAVFNKLQQVTGCPNWLLRLPATNSHCTKLLALTAVKYQGQNGNTCSLL